VSRPDVADFTERLYGSLPEFMRDADAADTSVNGFPLLRYLSLLGDQLGAVEAIADRAEAGELVDPVKADDAWLPWLGQLVGVRLDPASTPQAWRDAIADGSSGWQSGTREAIANAGRRTLIGTQYIDVRSHNGKPSAGGDPWTILIVVRADEAPTPLSKITDAVLAAGAKPAGFNLAVSAYTPTWDTVDAIGATWDPIDALGNWDTIDYRGA
jgi:hypothetical protein